MLATQLNKWQLLPRPARFTELYFTNTGGLSASAKPGSTQKITFTIHNMEHQFTAYNYKIAAMLPNNNTEYTIGEGHAALHHDQTYAAAQTVLVPSFGKRIAVKVTLSYEGISFGDKSQSIQTQSIDYWLNIESTAHSKATP